MEIGNNQITDQTFPNKIRKTLIQQLGLTLCPTAFPRQANPKHVNILPETRGNILVTKIRSSTSAKLLISSSLTKRRKIPSGSSVTTTERLVATIRQGLGPDYPHRHHESNSLHLGGGDGCTTLFTKSVWASAWAIFSSRDVSIWLLFTCSATPCRSFRPVALLSSACSEHTRNYLSTLKGHTTDADKDMQHNTNPQEPMTETEPSNRPMAVITTGSA